MAKIRQSNLDEAIVTGLTELGSSRADNDFALVYDSSSGTLKKIQASNLGVVSPTISSISPTNVTTGDGTGNATFTVTGTNFSTGTSAVLLTSSGSEVAFDTVTRDSSTQLTCVIAISSLSNANEPYDIKVTSNSISTTLANQVNIDAQPVYNTSAGSLASIEDADRDTTTITIEAYDPESAGNVTYEIQSGSLPAGATATTVHENGVSKYQISGFSEVASDTTSNFTIRAVDAASNTTSRAFSITVVAPTVEIFTASGTFSVPSGISSVEVLVVGGGGGGGGYAGALANGYYSGGGGAGGLVYNPSYPVTPGGTVSVTVGDGGGGSAGPAQGGDGQSSAFGTITAQGGGGGGAANRPGNGDPGRAGGSGGGGGSYLEGSSAGSGGPGQQGPSGGGTGYGNNGGAAAQNGPAGGGGGGAGAAGSNGVMPSPAVGGGTGGPGGDGRAYTIADGTTPVYYAGGGGGGSHGGMSSGEGGLGGADVRGTATANRGGGGGAGTGNGGKGVVIVRWA